MAASIPETGYLRLPQIVRIPAVEAKPATPGKPGRKARPETVGVYPVSPSTWWAGIKAGRYPQPIKLGSRITAWRVEDIRALIEDPARAAA